MRCQRQRRRLDGNGIELAKFCDNGSLQGCHASMVMRGGLGEGGKERRWEGSYDDGWWPSLARRGRVRREVEDRVGVGQLLRGRVRVSYIV